MTYTLPDRADTRPRAPPLPRQPRRGVTRSRRQVSVSRRSGCPLTRRWLVERQEAPTDVTAQCSVSAHRVGVGGRGAVGAHGFGRRPHTHGPEPSVHTFRGVSRADPQPQKSGVCRSRWRGVRKPSRATKKRWPDLGRSRLRAHPLPSLLRRRPGVLTGRWSLPRPPRLQWWHRQPTTWRALAGTRSRGRSPGDLCQVLSFLGSAGRCTTYGGWP
jgi:hypothetical protein